MKNQTVYFFAFINAAIVGLSFLFTKTAITLSNPLDTLANRFTISFLVLTLLIICKVININFRMIMIKRLAPIGLFYPIMFFSFQAFGLKYSQSAEAGILFASTPILTTILASYFLKEKTTIKQNLFILLSVFGVAFIYIMKGLSIDFRNYLGLILLLLSCLAIAGSTVMSRSLAKEFKPHEITYVMLCFGFIFFNGTSILTHLRSGTINVLVAPWSDKGFVLSILVLGIMASLVTAWLSNYILSRMKASQMSVFSNISTIISIIAGAVYLDEKIFWYDILGSIFIIIGVIGTNSIDRKRKVVVDTPPTTSIDSAK
jgi:drug/metabolite transporter (DMT)-like permease